MNKLTMTDSLKNGMIKGAIIGAALALIMPRRNREVECMYVIDDMEEAKKIISSIEAAADQTTLNFLHGNIDEETFSYNIDNIISNVSGGVLENKEDFNLYCEAYNKLYEESIR